MRRKIGGSKEGEEWLVQKDAELEQLRDMLGRADGEKLDLKKREAELEEQLSDTALEKLQEEMRMELQQQMRVEQNNDSLTLEKTMKEVDGGKFKFKFHVKSNITPLNTPRMTPLNTPRENSARYSAPDPPVSFSKTRSTPDVAGMDAQELMSPLNEHDFEQQARRCGLPQVHAENDNVKAVRRRSADNWKRGNSNQGHNYNSTH